MALPSDKSVPRALGKRTASNGLALGLISGFGTFETYRLRRVMSELGVQSGKYMPVLSSSQFDPKATFAVKPSQDQGDGRGSRSA